MEIKRSAYSLVIHQRDCITEEDIDTLLLRIAQKRGVYFEREEYIATVNQAMERYFSEYSRVMICTDSHCLKGKVLDTSEAVLAKLSNALGCPVETTGCHWHCQEAPVITLKYGERDVHYFNCDNDKRVAEVFDTIGKILDRERSGSEERTEEEKYAVKVSIAVNA